MIKEITATELQAMMDSGEPMRLIDVRTAAEVSQASIPGAEHMVMHTVPARLHELERDIPLVFYCRTGARSAQVCFFLAQQGLENAINLRGGIMDWARNGGKVVAGEASLSGAA